MSISAERIRIWSEDPVVFVRDLFDVEPDEWQKGVLGAFASGDSKMQRIAMKACVGPG
jgi:hypothetical protein